MMDEKTTMLRVAAVLSTLRETGGSIESNLYMLCDMNMADYELLRGILVNAGWVTIRNHYVTLTDTGTAIAHKIDSATGIRP